MLSAFHHEDTVIMLGHSADIWRCGGQRLLWHVFLRRCGFSCSLSLQHYTIISFLLLSKWQEYEAWEPLNKVTNSWLTPWNTTHIEKLRVPQLFNNFQASLEPEGSLLRLNQSTTCSYPELNLSNPEPDFISWRYTLRVCFSLRVGFPSNPFLNMSPHQTLSAFLFSPIRATSNKEVLFLISGTLNRTILIFESPNS